MNFICDPLICHRWYMSVADIKIKSQIWNQVFNYEVLDKKMVRRRYFAWASQSIILSRILTFDACVGRKSA